MAAAHTGTAVQVRGGDDPPKQQQQQARPVSPLSPGMLSPMLSPKSPKPTDPEELAAAIRKQVEFYFSDANLPTDKHLLKHISGNPEGYVPIKLIANFKRVKGLTRDAAVVADALRGSSQLAVDAGGEAVRRLAPLPAFDVTDICRRTVVAEHLPDKPTIESTTQLFGQYGQVLMVRICSRGSTGKLPAWLNKAVEAISLGLGQGEFALIEFATEEECVHCVAATRNPDNWRTSLRARHLLPNFKPAAANSSSSGSNSKGGGRRASESGGGGSSTQHDHHHHHHQHDHQHAHHHDHHHDHHEQQQHHHQQHGRDGRSRLSIDVPHHASGATSADSAGNGGGAPGGVAAAAAATAAAAGLPLHLAPIRTQPSGAAGSSGGAPGSPAKPGSAAGSPHKAAAALRSPLSVGGSIGSPRTSQSPAPPMLASFIDNILSTPTGSTPPRDGARGSGPRWSSASGQGDWSGGGAASPAAAVAAALAGVTTPPQSGSPRHSMVGSAGGRASHPGGALGTPTRLSVAGGGAWGSAGAASGGSPLQPALASAAAAASAAMLGSPRASGAGGSNWRSGGGGHAPAHGSCPGTPLGGRATALDISAGAAVAAALEAASPPTGGGTSPFTPTRLGAPAAGGEGKPAPWVPASRLAHHRQAAGEADGSGGEANLSSSWRSGGGGWSGAAGSPPPSHGLRGHPKPRTPTGSSGGGGGSGDGARQRRRSFDAAAAAAAAAAGGRLSLAAADGALSDGSGAGARGSSGKAGRQGGASRLGAHAHDYHATIEAIREASCGLDSGAVGRAMASLTVSGGGCGGRQRRTSGTGGAAAAAEGEDGRPRGTRHRRSRSSGSRRQSMDEAGLQRHSFEEPASGGVGAVGLSPRGASRAGALAPDDAHHQQHHSSASPHVSSGGSRHQHSGAGGDAAAAASGGGAAPSSSSNSKGKREKKDYASWAAATPEFRAVAAAAKAGGSGGGAAAAGAAAAAAAGLLGTSPGRGGMSPMRGVGGNGALSGGGGAAAAGGSGHHEGGGDAHGARIARMPDGTRGFGLGRGRPLQQPQ